MGTEDNFFALGGDSILAIRVTSRLRAALGAEVSPRLLFTHPTVAALAAALPGPAEGRTAPAAAIAAADRAAAVPLSYAQQRLWFLDRFEPDSTEYLTFFVLRLRGHLDEAALRTALDALVARHEPLRTTFAAQDGRAHQQVHAPAPVDLPRHDLSATPPQARGAALDELLAHEGATPFDLGTGPLLRTRLIRLADDEHVLTLAMHHIVTDGWSTAVLGRDLGELYAAALDDRRPDLPPLPVQYADYAVWQRARTAEAEEQLAYWTTQLAEVTPLELPTDRPRPAVRTKNGALLEFSLPAGLTERLRETGRRADATLYMTLLAACKVLLARWAGQEDIAVGTVASGRERPELEHLAGMFVNTLVLRSRVPADRPFSALLADVRGTVLDAFAHQDVPFERLVDVLQPERDTSRTPSSRSWWRCTTWAARRRGCPASTSRRSSRRSATPPSTSASTSSSATAASPPSWSTTPTSSTPPPSSGWPAGSGCCWRRSRTTPDGRWAHCRCSPTRSAGRCFRSGRASRCPYRTPRSPRCSRTGPPVPRTPRPWWHGTPPSTSPP